MIHETEGYKSSNDTRNWMLYKSSNDTRNWML